MAWFGVPGGDLAVAAGYAVDGLSAPSATPAPAPLTALVPAGPTLPVPPKTGEGAVSPGSGATPVALPFQQESSALLRAAARARALQRTSLEYIHRMAMARSGLISSRSTAPPHPLG